MQVCSRAQFHPIPSVVSAADRHLKGATAPNGYIELYCRDDVAAFSMSLSAPPPA
jgi:hypothetical protein